MKELTEAVTGDFAGRCKDDADPWRWEALMSISDRDRTIIREAAKRMADIAASPEEAEKTRLRKP